MNRSPYVGGTPQFARLLLEPDPPVGSGGGGGKPALDPNSLVHNDDKPVNLDGKTVTFGGKTYTAAQLGELQKNAASAAESAKAASDAKAELDALNTKMAAAYAKGDTLTKEGREAMVELRVRAGWTKDDAAAAVEEKYGPEGGEPGKGGDPEPQAGDPLMQAQVGATIDLHFEQNVERAVGESGDIKKFVDAVRLREGVDELEGQEKEAAERLVAEYNKSLQTDVKETAKRLVIARIAKEGKASAARNWPAWFKEASVKAVEEVAKRQRVAVGDPNVVGRGSISEADQEFEELTAGKPVAMPRIDPADPMSPSDFNRQMESYFGDAFARTVQGARKAARAGV